MQLQLPPLIPYFIGAMLVVFGALRAYHLGWQRMKPGLDGDGPRPEARRHLRWGLIWVALGLFLVISTLINTR